MGFEIEKKFIVRSNEWMNLAKGVFYRQGYLSRVKERTVRVRTVGNKGFITVKGISTGAKRREFEYEISFSDATEMLNDLCEKPLIEKERYKLKYEGMLWEVDKFLGDNEGLICAEIELIDEDQKFKKPDWIGEEVTGDPKYFNSNLVNNPYKKW